MEGTHTTENTMDSKINKLNPGGSVILSETENGRVVAERSGDGKTLRFVRINGNGFVVFKTCTF